MNQEAEHRLVIDGELSIYRATELRQVLLDWSAQCEAEAVLDLSGVTEMDSAGLQLLLALERTLAQQGQTLQLAALSPAVAEVLTLAQCTHWLEGAEVTA